MLSSTACPDSSGKSRTAGKMLIQTLFFFLLITQICLAQWVQVGLNDKSIKDIAVQNSNIFAVTSDSGKVYRSLDSGTNWTMIIDSNAVDVAISQTGKVFMVWDSLRIPNPYYYPKRCLLFSLDNGNTWTRINIMEQLIDSIWGGSPKTITVSPEGIVFCGIWAARPDRFQLDVIAISNDDGLVWMTPGTEIIGGHLFDFRDQFVITFGIIMGCGAGGEYIHMSSDYGNNWTFLGWPPTYNSVALEFFSNGNIILGSTEGIYLSVDMCINWTLISSLNTQVGLSWSSGSSEGMLIGTEDLGIFLFSDEGDSLGSRNDGLTNLNVQALTLDNNGYVYAGTDNGVWRRPLSEIVTSVKDELNLVSDFNLSQNYPNPFNPSTKISWQSPVGSWQTLKVYDILGNEITTIIDEYKPAGKYETEFAAVNLTSGVYFYQLRAGSFIETKKMLLLK